MICNCIPGGQKEQEIQEVKDVEVKSTEEVPAALRLDWHPICQMQM